MGELGGVPALTANHAAISHSVVGPAQGRFVERVTQDAGEVGCRTRPDRVTLGSTLSIRRTDHQFPEHPGVHSLLDISRTGSVQITPYVLPGGSGHAKDVLLACVGIGFV